MGMMGGGGGFGRSQGGFQMPNRGFAAPQRDQGMQQMGRNPLPGGLAGLFGGGGFGGTSGYHPMQKPMYQPMGMQNTTSHHGGPMGMQAMNGQAIGSPPSAFGFGNSSLPPQNPMPRPLPTDPGPYGVPTPFPGPISGPNRTYDYQNPWMGPYQTGGTSPPPQQPPAPTFTQPAPQTPSAPSWDPFRQETFTGESGQRTLDLNTLRSLGANGLSLSGLQMGNDMTAGRNGSMWVQDAQGNRLGGVDQLTGKPLPFDLSNLDPNGQYSFNWSGMGPGGFRVQGRKR